MKFTKVIKADESTGMYQNLDVIEKINDLYNVIDSLRDVWNKVDLTYEQIDKLLKSLDLSIEDLQRIVRLIKNKKF